MSNYWSQYWQQGHLTSFGEDIKDNYEGELKAVWDGFFVQLSEEDRVLDIGTGNGAVVALALAHNKAGCQFVGIDYAKLNINNQQLLESTNASFKEHVSVENLPFETESYNMVTSQFAIEYTDLTKSVAEIARVLKFNGTFQLVCHHEQSSIVKPNNGILAAAEKIMTHDGPYKTCMVLIELLSNNTADAHHEREVTRNNLNGQLAELSNIDDASLYATNFPQFLKNIFSKRSVVEKKRIVEQFGNEMAGLILRLNDLKKASLNETQKNELLELCKKNGLQITACNTLTQKDGTILAHQIMGMKPELQSN